MIEGRGRPGSEEVREASWIRVVEIRDNQMKRILQFLLDEGESEVIVLALRTATSQEARANREPKRGIR